MSRRVTRNSLAAMADQLAQLLDQKLAPLTSLIENLTQQVKTLHNQVSNTVNKDQLEEIVNTKCAGLIQENKELRDRIVYLESQSRRNNLRFTGLEEKPSETWLDCENKVQEVLSSLGISDAQIERAHRLGTNSDKRSSPRLIICKFLTFKDRERTIQAARQRDSASKLPKGVRILEDFPPEIDARRRHLIPYMVAARNANARARISYDKLVIEGHTYTVDLINEIPKEYHPVHTKEVSDSVIAFYTAKSPLSNFYPSKFSEASIVFQSVEHYISYKKAMFFNDTRLAEEILKTEDPLKAKLLGKKVRNFNAKEWSQQQCLIMREGLSCKFSQNMALKDELAATRNMTLVEANPHDKFWGAGISIYDDKLQDPTSYPGKNMLGKLLAELRASLCG